MPISRKQQDELQRRIERFERNVEHLQTDLDHLQSIGTDVTQARKTLRSDIAMNNKMRSIYLSPNYIVSDDLDLT